MKFKEIEFKYDASNISFMDFSNIVESLSPSKKLSVSSYDDYFVNPQGNFIRYRHNDNSQELTVKRKTCDDNNNERIEVNLKIVPQNYATVNAFVNLLDYKHNFSIYKSCLIYWVDKVVFSYYLVYDENMRERNRFIEIEANEELEFPNESVALHEIEIYEKKLSNLGINTESRLKNSLFEMYKM